MEQTIFERGGRDISGLYFSNGGNFVVGANDIVKIEPYREYGEMAFVTWFIVWQNSDGVSEHEYARVNSAYVEYIAYK